MDGAHRTYPVIGSVWWNKIVVTLIAVVPLALTVYAIVRLWGLHVSWMDIGLMVGFMYLAGGGITLGFHRMLTHKAFKARQPAKAILLWAAMNSLQGGPAAWAATHGKHHALADQAGDPHSPLEGFLHAHWGWLYKGNLVHSGPAYDKLMQDRTVRFFEKTQLVWYVLTFVLPGFIAAAFLGWGAFWQAVLWAGAVRVFLVHHITWSINSVCHVWGTRPYDSPDVARNNAIFGVLGFGEGWHNNHHAFPQSAYIGQRWWQLDYGKYLLVLILKPLGQVYDMHVPTREQRAAKRAVGKAARAQARAQRRSRRKPTSA